MDTLHIRIAKPEDILQYTDLLQRAYSAAYVNVDVGLKAEHFSKEVFESTVTQDYLGSFLIDADTQKTWLAFDDSRLVGAISCILKDENEAEVAGFYVSPERQGQGIGKRLYALALAFAGPRNLVLDTYAHNARTIAMYERLGWVKDATRGENGVFYRHWAELPEDLHVKCVYMRLTRYKEERGV
jgi:ribosomal protein S18 acetylase RimI-like enzyme